MKRFFFFLILFFVLQKAFPQANQYGIPLFKNYFPKEYGASEQNWAVVQDKRGVIYVGNSDDGVLEYDGTNWRKIPVANKSIVRSLAVDTNGTVFVGAVDEFGFLAPDRRGKLTYHSLSSKLDTNQKNISHVWKTYATKDGIYFCTQTKIYHYKDVFSKPEIIKLEDGILFSFFVNDNLYPCNYYKGLQIIKGGKVMAAPGGEFYKEKDIFAIMPYDKDNLLIASLPGGLTLYNVINGKVTLLNTTPTQKQINDFIEKGLVYHGCQINESLYAIATRTMGVIIFDNKFRIINILNKSIGLQDETAVYLYSNPTTEPISKPLWIALFNGLSLADVVSPIHKFGVEYGLQGSVKTVCSFKGRLYVGTSIGVYYLSYVDNQPRFLPVKNITTNCYRLNIFKTDTGEEILLATTGFEVFQIIGETGISLKTQLQNIYGLYASKAKKNTIYLGLPKNKGLGILTYNNKIWSKPEYIEDLKKEEIQDIVEDRKGNLWVSSGYNGIYRLSIDGKLSHYDSLKGIISLNSNEVEEINGNIYVASIYKGLFKYNEQKDRFEPTSDFGNIYTRIGVRNIIKDGNKYWLIVKYLDSYGVHCLKPNTNGQGYSIDSVSFKRIPGTSIECIYPDTNGIVWIGGSEGLFSFDTRIKHNYKHKYHTLLRQVRDGKDSVLFEGTYYKKSKIGDSVWYEVSLTQPKELIPVLEYERNSLRFYYSAPYFEEEGAVVYSHYLEGFSKEWSKWTTESYIDFTNLLEGKYIFRVKAKNIYGVESEEATFEFEILPPWYRTFFAYFLYLIGLILLIYVIVKLSIRRLQKLNEAYGKYLPGSFLKALEKRRVIDFRLGDMTEREMTIMFSDIRSYTNLSETMTPAENFRFQVRYLSQIGEMLNKNNGFAVQFYGDGVVAMFPGDTDNAVQASIDMHKKVAEYSEERIKKGRRPLKIGVGMHTGRIVMGIRGDAKRWEGGIVGDSVNLASRMEGLTKMFGASTCISEDTYKRLRNPHRFNIRFLAKVKVKGKDIPVGIYEVLDGLPKEEFDLKKKTYNDYDAAIRLYFDKDFELAKKYFTKVIEVNPDDVTAKFYLEKIEILLAEGVPQDWDGVEKLDKK